jgi:hypothetical protein
MTANNATIITPSHREALFAEAICWFSKDCFAEKRSQ